MFRTFCHISEYGEAGYANLHRLVAGSRPLVLWAPSSVMLRAHSSIAIEEFLVLLREGLIRIMGRERWLLDRSYRNRRAETWAVAAWDDEIDGEIHRLYINELHVADPNARTVIVAEEEPGRDWAERTLSRDAGLIGFWQRVLARPDVADCIPGGTLEAIQRENMDPEVATLRILRDARNHGQAVRDAAADVPFLLSRADSRFLEILTESRLGGAAPPAADLPPRSAPTDALAEQLLEVLERLDECRDDHRVLPFIRRKGHDALIDWLVGFKTLIEGGSTIDQNALMRDLALKARQSRRRGLAGYLDGAGAVTGTLLATGGAALTAGQFGQDQGVMNALGLTITGAAFVNGLVRELGMVEGSYDGEQWPYLYTSGRKATRRSHRAMLDHLAAR
ncbi:hypothetical protein [Actinoplanes utahensis]|uniref:hypothetical protein n=1 Tax=Actinoplanes utahensis TaxID=1869 RepID=UPI000A479B41|nr:hypothetical protein [Actinoplanes utahensis]GIF32659.1 hypothetical protein Aut01nite_56450 [Actinoplanes utahensis]